MRKLTGSNPYMPYSAQISQKQDEHNIYVIMKTMLPPGYHHSGFVTTHALGHMMYIMCPSA